MVDLHHAAAPHNDSSEVLPSTFPMGNLDYILNLDAFVANLIHVAMVCRISWCMLMSPCVGHMLVTGSVQKTNAICFSISNSNAVQQPPVTQCICSFHSAVMATTPCI